MSPDGHHGPSVFAPGVRLLTTGMVLIVTLVAFESMAVATVMPLVEDDLGDLWLYGWVFTAFFLGNLVGAVIAGSAFVTASVPAHHVVFGAKPRMELRSLLRAEGGGEDSDAWMFGYV
jgi:MFS family permease